MRWSLVALVAIVVLAGCGGSASKPPVTPQLALDRPPSPASWPAYPRFSARSCWTRPAPGGGAPLRAAPSYAATTSRRRPVAPAELVRRLLARFGDRRYVRRIELGPPPPLTLQHLKGWYAGARPPADALWAYIAAPVAQAALPAHPSADAVGAQMLAEWETELIEGALRDDFCAAGGRPLVGWSVSGTTQGVSDSGQALGQRFPDPTAQAFRSRVAAVGERYGFRVVSLRLLRPLQLAPVLVVSTDRARKEFVRDVPALMRLLDPIRNARQQTAVTFEGFYLEARDNRGAFVRVDNAYRGEVMGGQWSWNRCVYPYEHSMPLGARPCPG